MAEIDPNVLFDISTKIAGIDERTKAFEKNADHRHNNLKMQLDGFDKRLDSFVPRREIDSMIADTREHAETLAAATKQHCDSNREVVVARVEQVEKAVEKISENSTWIKRTLLTAIIGGLLSGGAYLWNVVFMVKAATH